MFLVFVYKTIRQVWPQKQTEERLRNTKFIILTSPRDRRYGTPCRATWRNTSCSGGRREELAKKFGPGLHWGFYGKGKRGQGNSVGLASLKYFGGLWAIGVVLVV